MTFSERTGLRVPPFPFIAHSRGWDAEDMELNVVQVKKSEVLRRRRGNWYGVQVEFWKILDHHRGEAGTPDAAGRTQGSAARQLESVRLRSIVGRRAGD